MDLRLPGSGSLLESWFDGLGTLASDPAGDTTVAGVTAAQLDQALDALRQGHIEYVILENGEAFLQVAGEGDGPYQVQFNTGSAEPMQEIRGGVDIEDLRLIVRAYFSGQDRWRGGHDWAPMR